MAGVQEILKNLRIGRRSTGLVLLMMVSVSVAFLSWFIVFNFWGNGKEGDWNGAEDNSVDYFEFEETRRSFKQEVICPARQGLELSDYWKCLWSTSITAEGWKQHRRILMEDNMERLKDSMSQSSQTQFSGKGKAKLNVNSKSSSKGRVRRLAEVPLKLRPYDPNDPSTAYLFQKMEHITRDLFYAYFTTRRFCQHKILPGVSIQDFIFCLQRTVLENQDPNSPFGDVFGYSLHSTFLPSTYPPMNGSYYDQTEFPLLNIIAPDGTNYTFVVYFKPLSNEENLKNFKGGDPYFFDQFSAYRYHWDNANSKQSQPSWTYSGKDSSKEWHDLDLKKFYVPLKEAAVLDDVILESDMVQSYPGFGEVAEEFAVKEGRKQPPLNAVWTNNHGYNTYTRYMVPLLQKHDLTYYKSKGLIDPAVTVKADLEIMETIDDWLNQFEIHAAPLPEPNQTAGIVTALDLPFSKAYLEFIKRFFGIDTAIWVNQVQRLTTLDYKALTPHPSLWNSLIVIQWIVHAYTEVAQAQQKCVFEMIRRRPYRIESEKEMQEVIEELPDDYDNRVWDWHNRLAAPDWAKKPLKCAFYGNESRAIAFSVHFDNHVQQTSPLTWSRYFVDRTKLPYLYNSYFDRKDARQRYSLPSYPLHFPICRHNDPSPIDISTKRSRQSSLRDYNFGPAAYRLNQFFMFYPMGGAPLLTLGIVEGERLDDSSVRLTGGAVKGQNLTFQYMHFHYANDWRQVGSEHWIDGKGAQMELQMVFTISGSSDPIKYWHVLARVQNQLFQFREKLVIIVAVLVDVVDTQETLEKKIKDENLKQDPLLFEPLAQAAYHFRRMPLINKGYQEPRGYTSLDPVFRFIDFIPRKSSKFYTYRGSLTWPPCFGYVIWSVYEQRLYMTKRQFDHFTKIPAYGVQDGQFAGNNFRKFDDIYVEEEHDPTLTYAQTQKLKKERTTDRHILVGYHDVAQDGSEQDELGVVGEEMYYVTEDTSGAPELLGLSCWILLALLLFFKLFVY